MFHLNFVSDASKTEPTNVVTRKYIIMIRSNYTRDFEYIYDFWKAVFYFAFSAVQLHVGLLTMIIYQRRS